MAAGYATRYPAYGNSTTTPLLNPSAFYRDASPKARQEHAWRASKALVAESIQMARFAR
jgi:hypothetical protein